MAVALSIMLVVGGTPTEGLAAAFVGDSGAVYMEETAGDGSSAATESAVPSQDEEQAADQAEAEAEAAAQAEEQAAAQAEEQARSDAEAAFVEPFGNAGLASDDATVSAQEETAPASLDPQATILYSGTIPYNSSVSWAIDSNYALSITGTGEVFFSYEEGRAPWDVDGCRSKIKTVSVAPTVTVTGTFSAFEDFTALESIDTSSWRFSNTINGPMQAFYNCRSLKTANVSGMVGSKSGSTSNMFSGCTSLETITGCDTWDTSGLKDMSAMFLGCEKLTSISGMDKWDTSNVTQMSSLFYSCTSLTSLDLSSFDCSSVEQLNGFFPRDASLATIKLGPKWKFNGTKESLSSMSWILGEGYWKNASTGQNLKGSDLITNWSAAGAGTYVRGSYTLTETNNAAGYVYYKNDLMQYGTRMRSTGSASVLLVDGNTDLKIVPDVGYKVKDVKIDGVSQGAISSYRFSNVTANRSVDVTFERDPTVASSLITFTMNSGGYIYGAGGGTALSYEKGTNQTFSFVAYRNYYVKSVVIDGTDLGPITSYTFSDLQSDHSIAVTFEKTSAATYTITTSAGSGGSLSPSGQIPASEGSSRTIFVTPFSGYAIKDVLVDGASRGAIPSYTFSDISANHTISATFEKSTFTITSNASTGGTITPLQGKSIVDKGGSASFGIIPASGYVVSDVFVDGVSVGTVRTYTFSNVTANHTISATFDAASFTVTVNAGEHGTVSPGSSTFKAQAYVKYTLKPDEGYRVKSVTLDGVTSGTCVTSYEVGPLEADHTLSVTFEPATTKNLHRLAGPVALDTMHEIVSSAFTAKGGAVFLARSDGYWDALTAAGLAGVSDSPVLLTDGNSLSEQTKAELERLKPSQIFICGGTGAVSDAVKDEALAASGARLCDRCAGETATGTACEIYKRNWSWGDTAFVATNDGYWDALSIAPYAYHSGSPIFLSEGKEKLSDETLTTMENGGVKKVYILGGEAAVSQNVVQQLTEAGITVEGRLAGQTAVETSKAIADYGFEHGMKADGLALATTNGYWDALTGAPLCGANGSVLLLVSDDNRSCLDSFVASHNASVSDAYIFGGTSAVSSSTESYLRGKLGW